MNAQAGSILCTSRYNFVLPLQTGYLLYNTRTGASIHYASSNGADFLNALCLYPARISSDDLGPSTLTSLLRGGFLVDPAFDELASIRTSYLHAKHEAPVIVTITTTNNCNLGCFYCFQKRDTANLNNINVGQIVKHIRGIFSESGKNTLHVDWYGGEPMLNLPFLETASRAIQELCVEIGVIYTASILTNGTLWPDDALRFVREHHIERVQITFDGMAKSHNKVRRYRERVSAGAAQFDAACKVIDKLHRDVIVDVRFNLSPQNTCEAVEFAQFGLDRGWFGESSHAQLQLAKLTPYSTEVDFLRKVELTYSEFEAARDRVRAVLPDGKLDRTASLDLYPTPRESVCAAVAENSIVIGSDGNLYNCGLQVTERHRAVGRLDGQDAIEPHRGEMAWWDKFDPTLGENCSRCSFLPVCWGACPKLHLEQDTASLQQQSEYWRVMLPRRLSTSLGLQLAHGFQLTDKEQFRS